MQFSQVGDPRATRDLLGDKKHLVAGEEKLRYFFYWEHQSFPFS
jgi:hypothetical protein